MKRFRVRPSKTISKLNLFVGLFLIGFGVMVVLPNAGLFGIVWLLVAVATTTYSAINAFSDRGIAIAEMEAQSDPFSTDASSQLSFDDKLRRLNQLRAEGLISESEFEKKRDEIMSRQW